MQRIRRTKALLIFIGVLTIILTTSVFAAAPPAPKTFGGDNVVVQPDGREIEFYEENTETLDKPGLYAVNFSNAVEKGLTVFVYVTDGNENVSYTAPKSATAKPAPLKLKVDGKSYSAPAYSINGENYLRIRDIAFILNGTAKQFGVAYSQGIGLTTLKTFSYDSKYTAVGGELKSLPAGNKTASPAKQKMKLNNAEINPAAYTIGGTTFVKLKDIANIIDFGLTWDAKAGVVDIDTSVVYAKPGAKAAAGTK